jgi:hypothetical protein
MLEIVVGIATTFIGVLAALMVDRLRLPKIFIYTEESVNSDNTYRPGSFNAGQRWKFFRVAVKNTSIPTIFRRLLIRQTAENCRATVQIEGINNQINFVFKGRWASTPELPYLGTDAVVKVLDPEPVTILAGQNEVLDVFVKAATDKEAYGWNNESYFSAWRNKNYILYPGNYKVRSNGKFVRLKRSFSVIIEPRN